MIAKVRRHPLARALRVDKMTLAALDATLRTYQRGRGVDEIPVWQMIAASSAQLQAQAEAWAARLREQGVSAAAVWAGESAVGGGSLPGETLPTALLAVAHPAAEAAAAALRDSSPPVVCRIRKDHLLFDPRTVLPGQEDDLLLRHRGGAGSWKRRTGMIYVKLGGSLITDKRQAETPRLDVMARLAEEIQAARTAQPGLQLVLGHGSGSFGHVVAARHGTRQGVATSAEWAGFAEVADSAARLNRVVMAALLAAGAPAWSIQPSVALRCDDGRVTAGPEATVAAALGTRVAAGGLWRCGAGCPARRDDCLDGGDLRVAGRRVAAVPDHLGRGGRGRLCRGPTCRFPCAFATGIDPGDVERSGSVDWAAVTAWM